jgi:uncharacterized protein (TIGR03435 family)
VRLLLLTTAFMSVLTLPRLHAQATLAFETASVKPNDSRACDRGGGFAGGRFAMTCSTLRELITVAYPRPDGRLRFETEITGEPSWVNADHFDVIAKVPEGQGVGIDAGIAGAGAVTSAVVSAIDRMRAMLRGLLADRFKLAVRNEQKDLPVYELRMDRSDGTLGPLLKKVDIDCVALRGRGTPGTAPCGGFRTLAPGHIVGHGVPIALLATFLEMPVSRNVLDRTGRPGTFDVELQYAPDRLQIPGPNAPAVDPAGVSVFTAVREQLGLKLESTRAPVDVLVVDHVERPTPD